MQEKIHLPEGEFAKGFSNRSGSLRDRSDEVLIAVSVLGLLATVSDGDADAIELETFLHQFRRSFALSRRQALRIVGLALTRIRAAKDLNLVDTTCTSLNEHLDCPQKIKLFEGLAEVLMADGKVHDGEEYFLDYIAHKLGLLQALQKLYPAE